MARAEPRWHRFTTACAGRLDGGQIADLLWMTQLLAAEIPPVSTNDPAASAAQQSPPPQDPQALQTDAESGLTDPGTTQPDSTGASTSAGTQADPAATAAPSSSPRALLEPATGIAPPSADTQRVGVGEAGLLQRPRRIGRALAPLGRRLAAGPARQLDVPATVEAIARARLDGSPWRPVLRPRLEPWLCLNLLFDGHPSMALWQRLRRELPRTLIQEVRWRDLRCWTLVRGAGGGVALCGPQGQRCNPRRLHQFGGRGLVLVVSDAIAPGWRDGSVPALLASWAEHQPVLLLQVLPPRLWPRSGLGQQEAGWVQAGGPLQPNPHLHWHPFDADPFGTDPYEQEEPAQPEPALLTLPLATVEPDDLAAMARLLIGNGGASLRGFRFALPAQPARRTPEADEPPPQLSAEAIEQQLALFLFNASPQARRLLGLLSFAPVITLPVVRLIQGQVAGSSPAQVAEVLFSGLFRNFAPAPSSRDAMPAVPVDRQLLSFVDEGLRPRLRDGLRVGEARAVFDAVVSHVAHRLNRSVEDFEALLKAPPQESQESHDDQQLLRAFASVAPSCLRGLGSRYEQLADAIEQAPAFREMTAFTDTPILNDDASLKPERGGEPLEGSSQIPKLSTLEEDPGKVCVYISFSEDDPDSLLWVDLITAFCVELGHEVLRGSAAQPLSALAALIAAADVLICLVASSYGSTPLCSAEVAIAMEKGKPLFPVQLLDAEHDTPSLPLPFGLDSVQVMQYPSDAYLSPSEVGKFKREISLSIHEWVANGRQPCSWDIPRSSSQSLVGSSIFISYTGRDPEGEAWADRLVAWCHDWQYGCFRDRDHSCGIKAGADWRAELYQQLGLAQVLVCLVSRSYESSAWCVGEVAIAVEKGKTVIPIYLLDTEAELKTQPLPLLLQDRQAIQVARAADPSPEQLAQVKERLCRSLESTLMWRKLLPWDPYQPPYPGLPAFEEHQAPVFFGRDRTIEEVVERLGALSLRPPGFLLLLGASGYGKSSLVRAGVVPRLKKDPEQEWLVLSPFSPGDEPFQELEESVAKAGGAFHAADPVGSIRALQRQHRRTLVLVIDQFEELLTAGPKAEGQDDQGEAFQVFLLQLLRSRKTQLLVVATMRTDFLAPLQARWPALTGMASTITLEPIGPEDFGELITGPAERSALTLESGLQERLVAESGGSDALPLLACTLEKLWHASQVRGGAGAGRFGERWMLTLQDYKQLGGVAGVVSRLADACWDPQISSDQERLGVQEAFLNHLVTLTEAGGVSKRPARLKDLPFASLAIIQRMVNYRLLVQKENTVEIAHEALLRTWEPLYQWIAEGREALLQCLRVKRLSDDLKPEAPERQRRQALEQLAGLAAAGSSEQLAVRKEGAEALTQLLAEAQVPLADQEDAALVLALSGAEEPLRQCLANVEAPVALRRRAAESLGLLARRSSEREQCQRIANELEHWLRSDALDLLVIDGDGWAEHDHRLPVLQGASRGLQLAATPELPLLGSGPGRLVPMLTLTALEEGEGLHIRTEVVEVPVWQLPLPGGEQLELVMVEAGEYPIGSPQAEAGRDGYANWREGCQGVDVEALRTVRLERFAIARHAITRAQWRAVAELPWLERDLNPSLGIHKAEGLWEAYAQPSGLPVDSVSWYACREWLQRLNHWLRSAWPTVAGQGEAPQLAIPGEGQWEAACRARAATPFHFGDVLDAAWANFDGGYTYGRSRKGADRKRLVPVGCFGLVNRWGLAELHGQLFEWCGDQWHPNPLGEGWPADDQPWEGVDPSLKDRDTAQKNWRLLRGGSWFDAPHDCRAAFRGSGSPDDVNTGSGVRPCCPSPPGSLLGA